MLPRLLAFGAAAILTSAAPAPLPVGPLQDPPIVGDARLSLDSGEGVTWIVSNGSVSVPARVPGDLLTDLQLGGIIGDPLYEVNFLGTAWDAPTPWVYTTSSFDLPAGSATWLLVFDGIKMVADVTINGKTLGYTADQFLRYTYDISSAVKPTGNVITVSFPSSSDARNAEERWMSCSGGWDWAPYSTTDYKGAKTFSKGIWRSAYLVGSNAGSAALEHTSPRTYYKGAYPSTPLTDTEHGDFDVNVTVHFIVPAGGSSGTLAATSSWGASVSTPVTLAAGSSSAVVTLTASDVLLWWPAQSPAGLLPNRYLVNVTYTPTGGAPIADSRAVGFRVLSLVTANDTDPAPLAGVDGSGDFTMRFKVNGADIWARGANMIPMEEMEGRSSAAAHARLVASAVEGGFNIFRMWGGGIFQWNAFYEACDASGILIYHDVMYAQGNHAPSATPMQTAELQYQMRRLANHPSIVRVVVRRPSSCDLAGSRRRSCHVRSPSPLVSRAGHLGRLQ